MSEKDQSWAALSPEQTLKAAGHLYKDLQNLIVFAVFENGSVGTLFTSNSTPMSLMWILKAMDWDAIAESEDPMPLLEETYKNMGDALTDESQQHPVTAQAVKQMQNIEHVIVAGLTEDQELTMATSKDVNFMMTSFCVDWFRHQLLNQMMVTAQQQAQAQQAAAKKA